MYTTRKKIQKEKGLKPSEFEDSVAQAFFDLENGNQELKSDLKDLFINNAFQMDVHGNRKAVVIHVPYRLRKPFKKIHARLLREPEKKAVARCGSCCDKKNCEATQEGFSCSAPPHKDSDCRS